jgi:8-oxo-dGTP pyrophosphatase MutT (NUDIX family)
VTSQIPTHFRDANYNEIPYDGSPISWRVSIYGISIKDGTLLVIKNKEEKYYDIPGGGIEMGESFEEALEREGEEEAGWHLSPIKPVWTMIDWFYHNGEKKFYRAIQMFWLAEGYALPSGPTDPRTVDVKLVPLKEVRNLPLYPNVMIALEKIGSLGV